MKQMQLVFDEISAKEQEAKEIRNEYRDFLANTNEYEETAEELKKLREKKKRIENIAKDRMGERYEKLEAIRSEISAGKSMLTDIAVSNLAEGKSEAIKDKYGNEYEPVWSVRLRKIS